MRKLLWGTLISIFAAATAAFLFAWSGIYSIAASSGHLAVVSKFLQFGMQNSVRTYAMGIVVPPLGPAHVEQGMLYFQSGCAPCHGAPGRSRNPVALGMLPQPPDLTGVSDDWSDAQLFWIVKHGIKYTGMPAWPAPSRDDEVWALVGFLRRMPQIPAGEYKAATRLRDGESQGARTMANEGLIVGPFACGGCHGARGEGSPLGGVPRLAGQKTAYLEMALEEFAAGTRPSGMMAPPAANLDRQQRAELARYYSSIKLDEVVKSDTSEKTVKSRQLGAMLAEQGAPMRGIPACQACHGRDGRASDNILQYPALAGQHTIYLTNQLRLFRAGKRGGRLANVMSAAAHGLTDEDIEGVAIYYSTLK
ncbi:cytochrome c [Bradyrhizobium sp. R2.2-H]|jgi:cytochrome c553|uniref:c-type cytochrome n=1 Tax=unclassified Bradyrhizobium TaxID=2631580 RepID=UPI0010494D5E|nr:MULTISPECIES: c-type cytochrome [unclassified Bradyrhizobium]TCU69283.1 cytochrome c [Bradyrhizobium sp. Y-H1]TCU70775.1 cytochrome c [Bradyrhizobium sp. R2.2-H]